MHTSVQFLLMIMVHRTITGVLLSILEILESVHISILHTFLKVVKACLKTQLLEQLLMMCSCMVSNFARIKIWEIVDVSELCLQEQQPVSGSLMFFLWNNLMQDKWLGNNWHCMVGLSALKWLCLCNVNDWETSVPKNTLPIFMGCMYQYLSEFGTI